MFSMMPRVAPAIPKTTAIADQTPNDKQEATSTPPIYTYEMNPLVLAEAAKIAAAFAPDTIFALNLPFVRSNWSIRRFYEDYLLKERTQRREDGRLAVNTLAKDRQAIRHWEACTKPDDWDDKTPWPGVPLGTITAPYISFFLQRMKLRGYADATIVSVRLHLATIIHAAQRIGLIDSFKVPSNLVKQSDAIIYDEQQAEAIFYALRIYPILQASFVFALGVGPRPSDLFAIKWSDTRLMDPNPALPPIVKFSAKKTGRRHVVPLHPIVARHLRQLPRETKYVFPGLGSPLSEVPSRTTVSRRRTAIMKTLCLSAGVDVVSPFKVCRATAAIWIERVARGMSSVLLGHTLDGHAPAPVTRKHYLPIEMEPSKELIAAVNAVQWPDAFKIG